MVTVRYYMRLLQDEYQRDIKNIAVKQAIKMLFELPQFLGVKGHPGVTQQMARLQRINQVLA